MYQGHPWEPGDDGDDGYDYDICLPVFILASLGNQIVVSKKMYFF